MLSLTRMDISNMLEVQVDEVKEVDIKENGEVAKSREMTFYELSWNIISNLHIAVTPKELLPTTTNVPIPISQEEYNYYKLMFGNGKFIIFIHNSFSSSVNFFFLNIFVFNIIWYNMLLFFVYFYDVKMFTWI